MGNFLTPEQIGEQLGVRPKTVRDWLRAGDLIGIKVGKSWCIHPRDMDRLLGERLYQARLEHAARLHPDIVWQRRQCRECGILIPEPSKSDQWVCSPECRVAYDGKAEAVVGRGTEEFATCCGVVVPQ